uniref:Uncharacterized protein n=1 Tax=Oreochromis aureus TaxID=47969 RepID=A0AAZ1XCM2_OREAU
MWSSGFSIALDARNKLMDIIKDKLENDKEGFVGSLGSLPLPDSSSAAQHLLLFISALIPKALASLLTSFTLALGGNEQRHKKLKQSKLSSHTSNFEPYQYNSKVSISRTSDS